MLNISVQVKGLEQFPGQPEIQAAIRQAMRRTGEAIRVRADANLSGRFVRVRTGKLLRGLRLDVRETPRNYVVVVRNTVFYANMLEGGTAPHRIPGPRTRRELRAGTRQHVLEFQAGGKTIFARVVRHPGLRGRRWFASAVNEALPELQAIFEQELASVTPGGPPAIA